MPNYILELPPYIPIAWSSLLVGWPRAHYDYVASAFVAGGGWMAGKLHELCFSRSLPRLNQSATANYRQIGGNLTKLYHTHDPAVGVSTLLRSWSADFAGISHAPSWKAINYVVARYLLGISSPLLTKMMMYVAAVAAMGIYDVHMDMMWIRLTCPLPCPH